MKTMNLIPERNEQQKSTTLTGIIEPERAGKLTGSRHPLEPEIPQKPNEPPFIVPKEPNTLPEEAPITHPPEKPSTTPPEITPLRPE